MHPALELLLKAAIVPVLAALTAAGIGFGLSRLLLRGNRPNLTLPFTIAAGFIGADISVRGWHGFWPGDISYRISPLVGAALILGVLESLATGRLKDTPRRIVRSVLGLAGGFAVAWFVGTPVILEGTPLVLVLIGATLLIALQWLVLGEQSTSKAGGTLTLFSLAAVAFGGAAVLFLLRNAALAEISGAFGLALTVATILRWKWPKLGDAPALGAPAAVAFVLMPLVAAMLVFLLPERRIPAACVLAAAPLLTLVHRIKPLRRLPGPVTAVVQLGLIGLVLGGTALALHLTEESAPC
ncbi:MAG: hypothetical protein AAFX05_04370 [Planctomycetota bacterium]